MIACGDGADNNGNNPGDVNPSGGTEVRGENGELEITGAQVFLYVRNNQTGAISYTPYKGNMTLKSSWPDEVTATITGGKLSLSLEVPDNLRAIDNLFRSSDYEGGITASDPTAKGISLYYFWNGNNHLYKGNDTFSGNRTSGTSTGEDIEYVYMDKDVTISGTGKTTTWEDPVYGTGKTITKNFSLALKKGWNVVYKKSVGSGNDTNYTQTSTLSMDIPSHLRWILIIDEEDYPWPEPTTPEEEE